MEEEIVWFDLSEYGDSAPLAVPASVRKSILEQAELLLSANEQSPWNDDNFDAWFDILVGYRNTSMEWKLQCLLHMAVLGLIGKKEPAILF